MAQIGEPVRRYTVIPLEEPVSPTREPVTRPPPSKSPEKAPPITARASAVAVSHDRDILYHEPKSE